MRCCRPQALPLTLFLAALALALAGCGDALPGDDNSAVHASAPSELMIGEVQGHRARSRRVGEDVLVQGVVTADFSEAAGLGGVYLQDAGDGDPGTSDAIFLQVDADAPFRAQVRQGARLSVRGQVTELDAGGGVRLTALVPLEVEQLGLGEVAPTVLRSPPADWEPLEGMWVRIEAPLTVTTLADLSRFGEVGASFDGRPWQPAERAAPGSDAARAIAADNARRRFVLDDGRGGRDLSVAGSVWPEGVERLRSGSEVTRAEGIIDHRHGRYRLQLTVPPVLQPQPRPAVPRVAGDLRVASLNLENLFNGDGAGGGFPTPRGARTADQLARQQAKLVATLHALDPDIAGLMELENDGYGPDSSLARFVEALNADGVDWRFVDACDRQCRRSGRGPGDDAIRVGLVYRGDRVRAVGRPATLSDGPLGPRSRVPLAQAFEPLAGGPALVVAVNHFKSKGCNEAAGDDADNGAGCWNAARLDSASRLAAWLDGDPTGSGTDLGLIIGDLNSYAAEAPIQALLDAGWQDAFAVAGVLEPYSYVHEGEAGRLDHALATPALAERLAGAAIWHSNADEPRDAGYFGRLHEAGPWRSSDHDPIVVGFDWTRPPASTGN